MLHQILYIFQFTCLKLIINYCIKHGALYVNDLYIHWATIYILSWTTKKHQKILSRLLHSKLKKIQGLFKDLHRNLRTFQGKMEFKDFSRLCKPVVSKYFETIRTTGAIGSFQMIVSIASKERDAGSSAMSLGQTIEFVHVFLQTSYINGRFWFAKRTSYLGICFLSWFCGIEKLEEFPEDIVSLRELMMSRTFFNFK